jgi:hypothetical protein
LPVTRAFFYIFIGFPNKHYLLINQNLTFLSKPQYSSITSLLSQWGPYGGSLYPEPSFAYLSGSPVKEHSLQVPLIEPHRERHTHFQSRL